MVKVRGIGMGLAVMAMCGLAGNLRADRLDDLTEDWFAYQGALNQNSLTAIWQQQVTPQQAAQQLLFWFNYEQIPAAFNPILSVLQYKLGQLTHEAAAPWTPKLVAVCDALERYIALFEMQLNMPVDAAAPVTLLAVSAPDAIPVTDRMAVGNVTTFPEWTAVAGKVFTGAVLAVPRRPLPEVTPSVGPLLNADGVQVLAADRIVLAALDYRYSKANGWEFTAVPAQMQSLEAGFQVYLLKINLPGDLTPGVYSGTVNIKVPNFDRAVEMYYQLTVLVSKQP